MGLSLDGLSSGMDTTSIITQLMAIERIPQSLLKNKVAKTTTAIGDFQSLNQKIASLVELAAKSSKVGALATYSGTSSSDTVKVNADKAVAPSTIEFTVEKVATGQTSTTAAMKEWATNPPVITLVGSDGTQTQVNPATASLDDVAAAINKAGAGVTATKVAAGVDGAGDPLYRLQLNSAQTGAASSFNVFDGDVAAVTAGTATNVLTQPGAALIRAAGDAEVRLWKGTAAEQVVSSASNTFTGLVSGLSIAVSKASPDAVTVTAARDATKATAAAKEVVDSLMGILGYIDLKSKSIKSTDAEGNPITKLASFSGDSMVRGVRQSLVTAASLPVGGTSPTNVGFEFAKDGSLSFNEAKFTAALAADPVKAEEVFNTVVARLQVVGDEASDKYYGLITSKITGQESLSKSLGTQVESWDRRLEQREATLKRTYAALEVALSKMNAQSSYLASQIAGLPTIDTGSKK